MSQSPEHLADAEYWRSRALALQKQLDDANARAAAAEQAQRYAEAILCAAPEHILTVDRDGRIGYLNFVADFLAREEVRGHDHLLFTASEHRERLAAARERAFVTGQPQRIEVQDRDHLHWYAITLGKVNHEGVNEVVLVCHLVDALKQVQTELQDARELWRSLVANSPDVILLLARDTTVLDISKTVAGYTREAVIGHKGTEFVLPQYQEALVRAVEQAVDTRVPQQFEMEDIANRWWWWVTIVPVRNSQRDDLVLAVSADVTQRRRIEDDLRKARDELEQRVRERTAELDEANLAMRADLLRRELAERQLRESEERFRIIAETVPVAVIITRQSDGQVLFANRRTSEMLKAPEGSLVGRLSREFYADPGERDKLVARMAQSSGIWEFEMRLVTAAGPPILVSGFSQAIKIDGTPAVLSGFIDITRRMESEQLLRSERRLLKRLLELHERDRQLIAYEVHDGIVQDMTAALMFFESALPPQAPDGEAPNESFASGIRLLRGSIHEARRLINGLRPPILEDEGVLPAIEAFVAELEHDAGIAVELTTDVRFKRLAPALEMAIYRIVQEGLNNVWHHSRSPRAKVTLVQRDETVEISIEDWGIGFDANRISKRRYGLMGVRERARLLNGQASVESAPGKGTRLRVELPLIDALLPSGE